MEFLRLFAICIVGATLGLILKSSSHSFASLLAAFVSVAVTTVCIVYFMPFISFFGEIVEGTGFSAYTEVLLKVCGVGILTRAAAEICRDSGENVYAGKVMMAGKTAILICSLPVIKTLFEQIKEFMN